MASSSSISWWVVRAWHGSAWLDAEYCYWDGDECSWLGWWIVGCWLGWRVVGWLLRWVLWHRWRVSWLLGWVLRLRWVLRLGWVLWLGWWVIGWLVVPLSSKASSCNTLGVWVVWHWWLSCILDSCWLFWRLLLFLWLFNGGIWFVLRGVPRFNKEISNSLGLLQHGVPVLGSRSHLELVHEDAAFSNESVVNHSFVPDLHDDLVALGFSKVEFFKPLCFESLSVLGLGLVLFVRNLDLNVVCWITNETSALRCDKVKFLNKDL